MVSSRLEKTLNYPENLHIEEKDKKKKFDPYLTNIYGNEVIILIGNPQSKYDESHGIMFWPIYLVRNNNDKVIQIGVYEVRSDFFPSCIDVNDEINVENIGAPIIYSIFNPILIGQLKKINTQHVVTENEETFKGGGGQRVYTEIPEERKDIFTVTLGVPLPKLLNKETYDTSKDISEKYHEESTDNWVQKFMKNKFYTVNEGKDEKDDCFFSTIRDAFLTISQHTSVDKLREKISNAMTEELFQEYKSSSNDLKKEIAVNNMKLKELALKHDEMKKKHKESVDRNEQQQFINIGKKITEEHNLIKNQIRLLQQILQDFKFMDKINTLEELKAKVRTCNFWTETNWILSTVERLLNIKLIVLSSESFKKRDYDNIMDCGTLNDSILKGQGIFTPEFYIILERDAKNNYGLIGYKGKLIFKFSEVPYGMKKLIVDKCLEDNSGLFSIIPDFENMKKSMSAVSTVNYDELSPAKIRGLYDSKITFRFYDKANPKPLPGKGSGETIPKQLLIEFIELTKYPNWRQKLDNSWIQPFTLNNHKWASVEHYYQASKFKNKNQDFYLNFSLDSGTEMSKDVEMAKGAGSLLGKYKGEILRPKQVQIDPNFLERSKNELYMALFSKFSQNEQHDIDTNLKNLLLATKDAKLTHHFSGKAAEICDELMFVREKIKNSVIAS